VTKLEGDRFLLDVEEGFGPPLMERLSRFKLRVKATLEAVAVTCDERAGAGFDALGPPRIGDAPAEGGAEEVFEAARIRAGVPRLGRELTEKTIPQEAGAELVSRSVSFTKGCYTGQELVARLDSRGANVPRRIRLLHGTGPVPTAGDAAMSKGQEVGTVTSAARDGDDGFVALALLRRAFLESGTLELEVATAEGEVAAVLEDGGG
jgi:folate-binding protein YgfZ